MNIRYDNSKEIDRNSLRDLFLSVNWDSGNYPDKLQEAIWNSHAVVTAWDGGKLVGLVNSLSDGVMTAYFPNLLVRPDYQKQGIGKRLVESILEEYKTYALKVLIAYDDTVDFYKKCGFEVGQGRLPMRITYLKES